MTKLAPTLILAACVLACAAPLTQSTAQAADAVWSSEQVRGNGVILRQQRDLAPFHGVANGLAATVEIRLGATEGVTVETDENLLPLVQTVVEDGILKIQTARRNLNLRTKTMKIVVQAKSVDHISLGGSGAIDSDALRAPKVRIDLGGSGAIHLKGIDTDSLAVSMGGSGEFTAAGGAARKVAISIGGSGDIKMGSVRSENVSVTIGGSGQATVWARDTLKLTAAGSGDVHYYGDPQLSKTVLGSGAMRRLGASPQ